MQTKRLNLFHCVCSPCPWLSNEHETDNYWGTDSLVFVTGRLFRFWAGTWGQFSVAVTHMEIGLSWILSLNLYIYRDPRSSRTFNNLVRTKTFMFSKYDHNKNIYKNFHSRRWGSLLPWSAHARPSARPPIDMSGNVPAHVSAESPSNISPNPSEVISEVSEH